MVNDGTVKVIGEVSLGVSIDTKIAPIPYSLGYDHPSPRDSSLLWGQKEHKTQEAVTKKILQMDIDMLLILHQKLYER